MRLDSAGARKVARAIYLPSDVIEVRLEPLTAPRGSFVRTQSVHFDLDVDGHVCSLEVVGPPRAAWKVCALEWPKDAEMAQLRFVEPEACSEEEAEAFETNSGKDLLRVMFSSRQRTARYIEPADGVVFGTSEDGELSELWIAGLNQ